MVYPAPHGNYFEGVLQLRGTPDEVLEWVFQTTKHDLKSDITKEVHFKHGIDLFFSDQRYLRALGKKLRAKFPGVLKSTRRIHTEKDSRAVYRVTVLFRYCPLRTGDVLEYDERKWKVISIGNYVALQQANGRKLRIKMESLCS